MISVDGSPFIIVITGTRKEATTCIIICQRRVYTLCAVVEAIIISFRFYGTVVGLCLPVDDTVAVAVRYICLVSWTSIII